MKRKMNSMTKHGLFVIAVLTLNIFFSCKKEGPTKAVITVNDSAGHAVEGASVTLWQDTAVNQVSHTQANIRVTKTSDSNGNAEFEFTLEAYLNITAEKGSNEAHGFVRLKEHETVNQTVHF
jgi:hypothetical protein